MPTSSIAHIIFGTAGHVDHGKTSLVRALTAFDTDRHPEERQRGMSIDFAVAPYTSSQGVTIGIVDIPGHEDFIRNAISGASGVRIVILVVAADDGIMPQTEEHLLIATDLGAQHIIPVITKADLVTEERINEVSYAVLQLIGKYSVSSSEPIVVSSITGIGIESLRETIDQVISQHTEPPNLPSFRMCIRACFSSKGFGNIVTGIPDSGETSVDDTLSVISASGEVREASIRRIENYRMQTDRTYRQVSSAINIKDVDADFLERGSLLCSPHIYTPSKSLLAHITSHTKELKNNSHASLHMGTMRRDVELYMLETKSISENQSAIAQIKSKIPIALRAGDRFILRTNKTIAGGIILSRTGKLPRKSMRNIFLSHAKEAYQSVSEPHGYLTSELRTTHHLILDWETLYAFSLGEKKILGHISLLQIGKNLWLNLYKIEFLKEKTLHILQKYHRLKPSQPGMQIKHYLNIIGNNTFNVDSFDATEISRFLSEMIPEAHIKNDIICLKSFNSGGNEKNNLLLKTIEERIVKHKFVSKHTLSEEMQIDTKTLATLLRFLETEKIVRTIQKDIFSCAFIDETKHKMRINFGTHAFSLSDFRKLSNLSRNHAVTLLEFFDASGFTKREGDKRMIVSKKESPTF